MSSPPVASLRVHRFLPLTHAEGPGARACLWVQGCPIHCPGCAVPWTWPTDGGEKFVVRDLADRILHGPEVEGITFLGGEPFAQAEGLAALGQILRAAGLSVLTFSGYDLDYLKSSNRADWNALLAVTDLLIAGPFEQRRRDLSRPWVGSSNQQYHFFTPRYRYLEAELGRVPNKVEVRIRPDGEVRINGMIASETLQKLVGKLARAPQQATGWE